MFRVGEMAIMPGEVPPLSGAARGMVSISPLMITRLPKVTVAVTPWEASTRVDNPLGGPFFVDDPQEIRTEQVHKPKTATRMRFFKREAPNNMKKEVLAAKWWIIPDPERMLLERPSPSLSWYVERVGGVLDTPAIQHAEMRLNRA